MGPAVAPHSVAHQAAQSAAGSVRNTEAATALPAGGPRQLDYTVSVDATLARATVQLCFTGAAPPTLVYGAQEAAGFMQRPRVVSEAGQPAARALDVRDGHIQLAGLAADSCIAYDVDTAGAIEHDALLLAYPSDNAWVLSAELFLWRPVRRAAGLVSRVRFELPEGMQISTPWPERGDSYQLDESAFACRGHLVFGHFERMAISVPGAVLDAVVLDGFAAPTRALIADWLATAGSVVSLPSGAFPVQRAQVIVVPTSPSHFPIHFGYTGRSGGASIVLFTPTDMDLAAFRADWIAIHEFSHLLHPFVERDDAWLSEGLATYLQEVLRVRAGLLPAQRAWQRLFDGAARGRETDQSLAHETRIMRFAGNYERVYWAGAAIALMVDVELRRKTGGQVSLDDVLAKLAHEPRVQHAVSAHDLLGHMDRLAGVDVFRATAHRYLVGTQLPDLTDLYRSLGLADEAGEVVVERGAPLAWIRDAIMAKRPLEVRLPRQG